MSLHVELVSPERILYSGEAEMVVCRTVGGGEVAFLSGHAPFLAALDVAPVKVRPAGSGEVVLAAVHGGFVHVRDDRVVVLSDVAELSTEVDVERARRAREAARGDDDEAVAARRRAQIRLDVAGSS